MTDDRRREGPGGDPSWEAALDANLRALGDVQRRGLLAAGDLVERLVAAVDGNGDGRGDDATEDAADGGLEGVVELWADVVKRSLRAITAPPAEGQPSTARLDVAGGPTSVPLRLTVDLAGETGPGGAELWLHNGTGEDRGRLSLHHGELRSHGGAVLAAQLRFDPGELDALPARSSRGVVVTVELLEPSAAVATYRGVVLVSGLPDAWLPVEVVVSP